MTRVAIVGAGLSGLAAAFELNKNGIDVTVFEAQGYAGGVVRTMKLDGCLFERGPNTVPSSARHFRELAVAHGLEDSLVGSSEQARKRQVWFRGRLVDVPLKPPQLLTTPLFSLGAKLRIAREPFRRWREPVGIEPSFGELLRERIGPEPTERLAAAFVRGIYAGDVDNLGAKSAFPGVWEGLREHGSLIRFARAAERAAREADLPGPKLAAGRLLGLRGGLDRLPRAMAEALGERVRLNTPVEQIERTEAGFRISPGRELYDRVILATPAPATALLLNDIVPSEVIEFLESIEHASLDVAHATFNRADLPSTPEGFGYLVPPSEAASAPPVLGTIYAGNLFDDRAPAEFWNLSAFYAPSTLPLDPTERRLAVAAHFAQSQGWKTPPPARSVAVDVWRDVIPQATVGFAERRAQALALLPESLTLAGTFAGGVAVDQVLATGLAAASRSLLDATRPG